MSKTSALSILICAASVFVSSAYATTSSVTCTVSAVTVTDPTSCTLKAIVGEVNATAAVAVSDGVQGSVSVSVDASDTNGLSSTSATAFADGSSEFTSGGVVRLGKIDLQSNLVGVGSLPSDISISDGTHTYSYGCTQGGGMGCQASQVLPFFLGSNFFITMSQGAEAGASKRSEDVFSSLSFSLQEMDGTAALSQLISTPEPSTSASMMLAALFGLSAAAMKKIS